MDYCTNYMYPKDLKLVYKDFVDTDINITDEVGENSKIKVVIK